MKFCLGFYLNVKTSFDLGTSLVVQWLGLRTSTAGGMGSIPGQAGGELRCWKLYGAAKKKEKKRKDIFWFNFVFRKTKAKLFQEFRKAFRA